MAKFCTKCGAPLVEGEVHVCAQNVQVEQEQVQPQSVQVEQEQVQPQNMQVEQEQVQPQNMQGAQGFAQPQNMQGAQGFAQPQNMQGAQGFAQPQNMQGAQGFAQPQNMQGAQGFAQPQNMQPTAPYMQQPQNMQFAQQQQMAKETAMNIFNQFKKYLLQPIAAGKEAVEKSDYKTAIVFIVLQAICTGLFMLVVLSKITDLIGLLTAFSGSYSDEIEEAVKLPMFRGFMLTIVLSGLGSVLLAGCIMAVNAIMKVKVSFKQALTIVSVRCAALAVAVLVALIVLELHVGAGLFVFFLTALWGFIITTLLTYENAKENRKESLSFLLFIGYFICIVVMILLFSKVWTLYLPDSVRTVMDNPSDFLKQIVGSGF